MEKVLLEYKTKRLLKKFGAGDHKPGSGSAAAFQGLVSAQLNHTVISLTTKEKRKKSYGDVWEELKLLDKKISEVINPRLEFLFQEDSILFDRVIKARKARDREKKNPFKWQEYESIALVSLKPATEILIEIATLCRDLAQISIVLFDKGFQSARGDTVVALSGALSAISGCISIIDLNLTSFESSDWNEQLRSDRDHLRDEYEGLYSISLERQLRLEEESKAYAALFKDFQSLTNRIPDEQYLNDAVIKEVVTGLQSIVWTHRNALWQKNPPDNTLGTLKPSKVFGKLLGYRFQKSESLAQHQFVNDEFEVAGIIDQNNKVVSISERFNSAQQNFTAAHELGHALLHKQAVLHRDRPVDERSPRLQRSRTERQADKFAALFLMPADEVRQAFEELFATKKFEINDDTAFALSASKPSELKKACRNLNGLAYKLSSAERYGPNQIPSLANIFGVTPGAMAIRLEELSLVSF